MKAIRAVGLAVWLLVLAVPLELPGCGGGPPMAVFVLAREPEDADAFSHGKLGVVQGTYRRENLVIAYRWLMGVGLSDVERDAIAARDEKVGDTTAWVEARAKVGVPGGGKVEAFRTTTSPGYFDVVVNCGTDAFRTAARTLAERDQKFGRGSDLLTEWVRGQDAVFANCAKDAPIPETIAEGPLRADREYQRAAAKFYARQFADAGADFERIARDRESPWREGAGYLAARCLIRSGKWQEADGRLAQVLADAGEAGWHERAQRLRGFVALRLRREERMRELGEALAKPHAEATIRQDLIDYTKGGLGRADDLSDWITSFQNADGVHAIEKWRGTRSVAWLAAALHGAKLGDAGAAELVSAAEAVDRSHPGYVMVNYDALRLMPEDRARVKAGELLGMAIPASARNLFSSSRMGMARNWDEFLRDAMRDVVGETGLEGESPEVTEGKFLGDDAGSVMNEGVPVALLEQASKSPRLTARIRGELRDTAMARLLLLSDTPDFDGVMRLLRNPGISPWVRSGFGRRLYSWGTGGRKEEYNTARLEIFRDNWWEQRGGSGDGPEKMPRFLSAAERRQATAEWKRLNAAPSGTRWLGEQTLKFAAAHPEDPRVPEALHQVVVASRYSAPDGEISKKCFTLLHAKFEGTEWAKKTPYWFK